MLYIYFLSLTISLLQSLPYTLSTDRLHTYSGNQTVFPGESARFKCQFDTPNGLQSPQYFEYRDPGSGFLKLETGRPDWNFTFVYTGETRVGPDIVDIHQVGRHQRIARSANFVWNYYIQTCQLSHFWRDVPIFLPSIELIFTSVPLLHKNSRLCPAFLYSMYSTFLLRPAMSREI